MVAVDWATAQLAAGCMATGMLIAGCVADCALTATTAGCGSGVADAIDCMLTGCVDAAACDDTGTK